MLLYATRWNRTSDWELAAMSGLCPVLPIHITTFNAPHVSGDDGRTADDRQGGTDYIERMTDVTDGNDAS